MRALPPRFLAITACAVAAGLLAGCGSAHGAGSPPGAAPSGAPAPPGGAPSRAPAVIPVPGKATGLIPGPRGLTDRLVLRQTRVTAGTPIRGTLLVTYRGRSPVNLTRGCRPRYAVVITNHRFPPLVAFPADCQLEPFMIKPGENRLAVTVVTTYSSCSQVAGQATRFSPACLPGRQRMPSLPAGQYRAVLVGDGLPLPAPAPVPVTLTAP